MGELEPHLGLNLCSSPSHPAQAPRRRCGWWERQPACSCTTRSAPDIPLAGFSVALASHIFILTSHGLGPFPPLPSRSLLIQKKTPTFRKRCLLWKEKARMQQEKSFMSFASILVEQQPYGISLFMILSNYSLCLIARRCC